MFRLGSLETKRGVIPIVVGLRAMASFRAVREAQIPYQQGSSAHQRIGRPPLAGKKERSRS